MTNSAKIGVLINVALVVVAMLALATTYAPQYLNTLSVFATVASVAAMIAAFQISNNEEPAADANAVATAVAEATATDEPVASAKSVNQFANAESYDFIGKPLSHDDAYWKILHQIATSRVHSSEFKTGEAGTFALTMNIVNLLIKEEKTSDPARNAVKADMKIEYVLVADADDLPEEVRQQSA